MRRGRTRPRAAPAGRLSFARRAITVFVAGTVAALVSCDRSSSLRVLVLRINEISARNESARAGEPNGLTVDWVEIHNPNDVSVRLDGYSLSDDASRPNRYRFPALREIPAHGFLVVWFVGDGQLEQLRAERAAAGLDDIELTDLHADFALSGSDDTLWLFADGRRIDRLGVRNVPPDACVGRFPDGGPDAGLIFACSPGAPNNALESVAPRFALGAEPRPQICVPAQEEVALTFVVLSDADRTPPSVRLRFVERPDCRVEDQQPAACAEVFRAAGAGVRSVDVLLVGPARTCAAVLAADGEPEPPLDPECPAETTDGTFGTADVRVQTHQAFLPAGATLGETDELKPTILLALDVEDELGSLEVCSCYVYGSGCFSLVVNEYQPVNRDSARFLRVDAGGTGEVIAPDWIEILNYGDEPLDLREFALAGRGAIRAGNLRQWVFGRDTAFEPQYTTIGPGERRLVLAENDGGELRRQYRRLVADPGGDLVPDGSCLFYSTRFALDAGRGEPDRFALTAPVGNFNVIIDEVVLDFRQFFVDNPPADPADPNAPVRDLAFLRPPGGIPAAETGAETGAGTPRDAFPPGALAPGLRSDCATPAGCAGSAQSGVNRLDCAKGPQFFAELAIVAAGGSVTRCPAVDESVLVTAVVAIDATTFAAFESGAVPSFRAALEIENALGERSVFTLADRLSAEPAGDRASEAPPGTVLVRLVAEIPPQPLGVVRVLRIEVWDDLVGDEVPESERHVVLSEQDLIDADDALDGEDDDDGRSRVSFAYSSGADPLFDAPLLSEVMPENATLVIPGFEGFVGGQSPSFIELHLAAESASASVDLGGFYLTRERGPGEPIREARRVALPHGMPLLERGGYLLLVLGPVPPRDLRFPAVSIAGLGIELDRCAGTVHLIAPDELGNCVVDSLSWNCASAIPPTSRDAAFGRACEDPSLGVRVTPSPAAPNVLDPILVSARHVSFDANDPRPNPCDLGALAKLSATALVDRRLFERRGSAANSLARAGFRVSTGTLSGSVVFFRVPAFDTPERVAIEFTQTFLAGAASGVIEYDVLLEDRCGGIAEDCGAGACFTLRTDGSDAPALSIHEVNRHFALPGGEPGDGRPWIELFNPGDAGVDLGGRSLSFNTRLPRLHTFADGTLIPARGTLVLVTDGGTPLVGPDAPHHVVIDFDWVPRRDILNSVGEFVGTNCGFDPDDPARSARPVELWLIDRVDRGSCLIDSFRADFPDPECDSPVGLGRREPGGEITRIDAPSPGVVDASPPLATFVRGDADGDGRVTISDPVGVLEFLFRAAPVPRCLDVFDADDDGRINVSDAVRLLDFLFQSGDPPQAPFPDPGPDPTADELRCDPV